MVVEITSDQYAEMAQVIRENANAAGYYNGNFDFAGRDDTITVEFEGSIILNSCQSLELWGWESSIVSATSIMAECHTIVEDGEVLNDFQFKKLEPYLLD